MKDEEKAAIRGWLQRRGTDTGDKQAVRNALRAKWWRDAGYSDEQLALFARMQVENKRFQRAVEAVMTPVMTKKDNDDWGVPAVMTKEKKVMTPVMTKEKKVMTPVMTKEKKVMTPVMTPVMTENSNVMTENSNVMTSVMTSVMTKPQPMSPDARVKFAAGYDDALDGTPAASDDPDYMRGHQLGTTHLG